MYYYAGQMAGWCIIRATEASPKAVPELRGAGVFRNVPLADDYSTSSCPHLEMIHSDRVMTWSYVLLSAR